MTTAGYWFRSPLYETATLGPQFIHTSVSQLVSVIESDGPQLYKDNRIFMPIVSFNALCYAVANKIPAWVRILKQVSPILVNLL